MNRLDLDTLYTVTEDEFGGNVDYYLELSENGTSPIRIKCNNGKDLLLFEWNDYLNRFKDVYTKEQIEEIERACREYDKEHNENG
ncbi:MAG: hypothetical protein MR503_08570 [Oscillospiraceae bacterium]|jgi:hypothetical protein|uniref:hypothetical protein n=1 Tax=Ruminococcus flavefaciens TaxID=1265 RepID=UPI001DCD072C|nr:hypothetical protein [Ruminococcus flavefaciens]MBP1546103.1 hypothetical protein [Oscillospiraceae bacterium]MCI7805109.1 hypothetical protein [Oscillospiraceae bacterium]MDD7515701.1 hypothetical protein [Ruminococcus flavefaciens]MDY5692779.1 hypothetical protein [Ruminococcus flavefaciens]